MKGVYKRKGAGAPIPFCSHARKTEWDPEIGIIYLIFVPLITKRREC
nr:MAG TPA: hypothetical protein [Siphoviridae sp. ctEfY6]